MPRKNRLMAFVLIFALSGIYVFVFGESGLLERVVLDKKRSGLEEHITALKEENRRLRELLSRYEGGRIGDKDILDSGFTDGSGKILTLKGIKDSGDRTRKPETGFQSDLTLGHMRILWVVISMLILLFYFSRREKRDDADENAYQG